MAAKAARGWPIVPIPTQVKREALGEGGIAYPPNQYQRIKLIKDQRQGGDRYDYSEGGYELPPLGEKRRAVRLIGLAIDALASG